MLTESPPYLGLYPVLHSPYPVETVVEELVLY